MATYKVLQDIEAEDKLLGPLTLKQFIFAGIAAVCGYLSVISVAKGAPFLLAFLAPPMLFTGFMAWPWSKDQPTETWLLAKLRFFFKPRRRIWDQSGIKQLVTITAPKREEHNYTDGLSQTEVKSRLQALANTIDSRGWAIKNVDVNLFAQPTYGINQASDRLIDPNLLPREVSNSDITASDDILDEQNNPAAQQLDQMIQASSKNYRQQIVSKMQQANTPAGDQADYWFMNSAAGQAPSGYATFDNSPIVRPGAELSESGGSVSKQDEAALLRQLQDKAEKPKAAYGHMKTINPAGQPQQSTEQKQPGTNAQNWARNNDLDLATLSRQVNKKDNDSSDGEVVIPLR